MLREDNPTHPEYLAMMQCIEARRDERIRIAKKIREYEMQALRNFAVARRSQILVQFQQEVRDIREKNLEQLGKQWYEIQHDRRSYAGSVPDYALKFPTRRSQQIQNQIAYSHEVSILSGIAKYVGFPAAPPMAQATAAELEEDFEKMGVSQPLFDPKKHKLTYNSEPNRRSCNRQRCLFKSSQLSALQVRHHGSSRPRSNSLSRHRGRTLNIPPTHTCFNGRHRLSRHPERPAPFLRFKFSLDGIHINMVLECQYQAPFPILLQLYSTILMALQSRVAAFRHTIRFPSETPLSHTPLHPLR
jgi:Sds3-like